MPDENIYKDEWVKATDEQVAKAFRCDKDEYSPEAQVAIEEEYTQRMLCDYHEPTKKGKRKNTMKHLAAITACFIIGIAYICIGVIVFGWKNGGGIIPMMILFAIWGVTWKSITKGDNSEDDSKNQDGKTNTK